MAAPFIARLSESVTSTTEPSEDKRTRVVGWDEAEQIVRHRLDRRYKYFVTGHYRGGTMVSRAVKRTIGCAHCLGSGCRKCGGSGKRVVRVMDAGSKELVHYPKLKSREVWLRLISEALRSPQHRLVCDGSHGNFIAPRGGRLEQCQLMVASGYMERNAWAGGQGADTDREHEFRVTPLGIVLLRSSLPYIPRWSVSLSGGDVEVFAYTRAEAKAKAVRPLLAFSFKGKLSWKQALMAVKSVRRTG